MKKRFLSLLCALALCLGLLPVTALAAEGAPSQLYVGNQPVISGNVITYWTTDTSGGLVSASESDSWNVKYDPTSATLTLKNATIKGVSNNVNIVGAGIYAASSSGSVSLNIVLEGENEVTGGYGINVSNEGAASLSISGSGSLTVSATATNGIGIFVQAQSGDANLTIDGANVNAVVTENNGRGVELSTGQAGNPNLTIEVKGGSLQASGQPNGIKFFTNKNNTQANANLKVSGNAMVKTSGITTEADGSGSQGAVLTTEAGTGETGGIVWNGSEGTVYGSVTLQDDLTIGAGESLTIENGASLNTGSHEVIVNGGTLTGGERITGTVKYAPTITTQPTSQTVTEGGTATFTVVTSGTEPLSYRWQQSTDSGRSWTDIGGATDATYNTEATTTSMNGYQYRCVVSNSAGSITSDAVSLTVNEHVHTWGNPVWNWSEDGKTCTVTFTCQNDETHKETPAVTVTSAVKTPATCTETGVTTYTAIVELNGQTYTDTKEVADIPATGHRYENGKCIVCSEVDPAFKAMIIEGANGEWQKGSEDALSFTSSAAFADFLKVQIDGKDVDSSNYTVKAGSTIVTLKPSYLETLSAGKHTLAIVSDTGTAETEFTVVAAEKQVVDDESANDKAASDGDKESLAKTGDDSMLPITVLSILAVASIATGVFALRRSRI